LKNSITNKYTSDLTNSKNRRNHQSSEVNQLLSKLNSFNSLTKAEQQNLLQKALQLCEEVQSYSLLITILRLDNETIDINFKADALAVVLNIADESHPLFADLIKELSEGERLLVMGILIEASRLEPDNDLRLLKLKRLISVIPKGSRSLYWSEALALSKNGSDDTQLALLGFVRQLPETAQATTYDTLKQSIQKVKHPYKRAMAFASLSEFISLGQEDFQDAEKSARQIPNNLLRIMTTNRLKELKSQDLS